MKSVVVVCAVALCATVSQAKPASSFVGVVTHVSDGDTLWVRPTSGQDAVKVRLQGIDAPEICQAGGAASQAALRARVLHHTVTVQSSRYDDYGRMLGRISLGTSTDDVGAWIVSQGHAWSYRYRNSSGPYAAQEQAARTAQRGLWALQGAIEPRLFRKRHGSCH